MDIRYDLLGERITPENEELLLLKQNKVIDLICFVNGLRTNGKGSGYTPTTAAERSKEYTLEYIIVDEVGKRLCCDSENIWVESVGHEDYYLSDDMVTAMYEWLDMVADNSK